MTQATLSTARLVLQPLAPEHKDFLFELDSDPEVMRYIGYGKPLSASDSAIVHKLLLETADAGPGLGCWAGFADGEFIGWWVLAASQTKDDPPKNDTERVEFGLRLLPRFWGKGYAKEGTQELLRHGMEDLRVREIFGETMAVNVGSRAIMAKCGLSHVRTFYNHYDTPPAGIEEGEVEYRITRDEWASLDPQFKRPSAPEEPRTLAGHAVQPVSLTS